VNASNAHGSAFSKGKMDKLKGMKTKRLGERKGTASEAAEKFLFCISGPSPFATHGG
jgi:hypothetical protein